MIWIYKKDKKLREMEFKIGNTSYKGDMQLNAGILKIKFKNSQLPSCDFLSSKIKKGEFLTLCIGNQQTVMYMDSEPEIKENIDNIQFSVRVFEQ